MVIHQKGSIAPREWICHTAAAETAKGQSREAAAQYGMIDKAIIFRSPARKPLLGGRVVRPAEQGRSPLRRARISRQATASGDSPKRIDRAERMDLAVRQLLSFFLYLPDIIADPLWAWHL